MEKPKYYVGQKVWTLNDSKYTPKAAEKEITGVFASYIKDRKDNLVFEKHVYSTELRMEPSPYYWIPESCIFGSKEELLASL